MVLFLIHFSSPLKAEEPPLLLFTLSYFNFLHNDYNALEGRVEYRSDFQFWELKTFAGVTATTDGTFYGLVGVFHDFYFGNNFVLTPSFAPGYFSKGNGKDLAYRLEFRSQIELSYRFENSSRLGINFNHISNAALGKRNPGVESLAVHYAIPTNIIFRN